MDLTKTGVLGAVAPSQTKPKKCTVNIMRSRFKIRRSTTGGSRRGSHRYLAKRESIILSRHMESSYSPVSIADNEHELKLFWSSKKI